MRRRAEIIRTAVFVIVWVMVLSTRPATTTATGTPVTVFTSQSSGPYQEALTGLRQYLSQQGLQDDLPVLSMEGDAKKAASLLQDIKKSDAKLLLTFGSLATQAAVREGLAIPLVASLVLNANDLKQAPNATAVLLEFPVDIQLQWLRRLLPQQTTVGVLFNPKENRDIIATATQVVERFGIKLIAQEVNTPQELPAALDSLAKKVDVLWSIADPAIFSQQTAEPLLLFSFENRIPFVGLAASWVKAGALYALDRDYKDIGVQCGELALHILNGAPASTLPPASPRKVTYSLNLKTADHMKIDISQALIDSAQQVFR
jgi:putative tryptophan/tyrosine transport system substrate-binding protein